MNFERATRHSAGRKECQFHVLQWNKVFNVYIRWITGRARDSGEDYLYQDAVVTHFVWTVYECSYEWHLEEKFLRRTDLGQRASNFEELEVCDSFYSSIRKPLEEFVRNTAIHRSAKILIDRSIDDYGITRGTRQADFPETYLVLRWRAKWILSDFRSITEVFLLIIRNVTLIEHFL